MKEEIYTDGYRNSFGAGFVIVIVKDGNKDNAEIIQKTLPKNSTNNDAEYEGVISACTCAKQDAIIYTDSKLVVGQVAEGWRINHMRLFNYAVRVKHLIKEKNLTLKWIPREDNFAGIAIEQANGFKSKG